jgi:hypothetical protein
MMTIGHNGGPQLGGLSLAEAQERPEVHLRPSHLQRYAGQGAPMRRIVGVGDGHGAIGQPVLLACGHWREIRDWAIMPLMGRKRPTQARCGCCRLGYLPSASGVARVAELAEARLQRDQLALDVSSIKTRLEGEA